MRKRQTKLESIYDCCSYLCFLQALMCCNSFWLRLVGGRFVVNKFSRLYSVLVAAIIAGIVVCIAYIKLTNALHRQHLHAVHKWSLIVTALELISSLGVFFVTVASMQLHAKQHLNIYVQLHQLDKRMCEEFGVDMHYVKLRLKNISLMAFMLAVYVPALYVVLVRITYASDLLLTLCSIGCYVLITAGPHFHGYVHINFAELLRIRFRLLQRILQPEYLRRSFIDARRREQRIACAINILKRLHMLVLEVNQVYRWSHISSQLHDFTLATSELYLIFDNLINGVRHIDYLLICLLVIAPLFKMIMGPIYCDLCVGDGRACVMLAQRLDFSFAENGTMRDLIKNLLFWQLRNEKQLHFIVGMPTLMVIMASIFNYIFIMIQFRMTEQLSQTIEHQKVVLQEWMGVSTLN